MSSFFGRSTRAKTNKNGAQSVARSGSLASSPSSSAQCAAPSSAPLLAEPVIGQTLGLAVGRLWRPDRGLTWSIWQLRKLRCCRPRWQVQPLNQGVLAPPLCLGV